MRQSAPPRQARLRPDAAWKHPGVLPDRWLPAAAVAAERLREQGGSCPWGRILPDADWEFRGGDAEAVLSPGRTRTRWSDYPGLAWDRTRPAASRPVRVGASIG